MMTLFQFVVGNTQFNNPVETNFKLSETSFGGLVSVILTYTLQIMGFLLLIWMAWGIFQYIFAGGNKDNIKKARGRITWAIIGFIFTLLAYSISGWLQALATKQ